MAETPIIYGLIDADTMELRYVGQTVHPTKRLEHYKKIDFYSNSNTHLVRWLHKVNWRMIVLERDPPDLNKAEINWIKDVREQGARLLNLTPGGKGVMLGRCHSEKTRANMTAIKKRNPPFLGHHHSLETKAKMSASRKGCPSPRGMLGHQHSDETKARMSAAHKGNNLGRHPSGETLAKLSAAMKGKKNAFGCHHSEESKVKMSALMQGHSYQTLESRAKMSAAKKGSTQSPESNLKRSMASKGILKSLEMRAARSASCYYNRKVQPIEWQETYDQKLSNLRRLQELLRSLVA